MKCNQHIEWTPNEADKMDFLKKFKSKLLFFAHKYKEAVYVTGRQFKIKFIFLETSEKKGACAIFQVANKRSKINVPLSKLSSNKEILSELHPVDASTVAFLSSLDASQALNMAPKYVFESHNISVLKEQPMVTIKNQKINDDDGKTYLTLELGHNNTTKTISAYELFRNHHLLYKIKVQDAIQIGYIAANDFLKDCVKNKINGFSAIKFNSEKHLKFYHIICGVYIGLSITGLDIVRRMFPLHVPVLNMVVPFGAGAIFFPLVFAIQDITTEVYGFARSRHMLWLTLLIMMGHIVYTQIAIHLPTGHGHIYKNNFAFSIVYNQVPRQFISLALTLPIGMLINDFLISKFKVIYGGRYLWARIMFSTMIGEAVLNIIGMIIGFGDIMHFLSQMLPNIVLSYGYKMLWNISLIPVIYLITNFIKKSEGVDVYDYDTSYNPFIFWV